MAAHSPFGGSQASRYMKCPGSIALAEHAPPAPSSVYAEEGTLAHLLAETALESGLRTAAPFLAGGRGFNEAVTQEMVDAVNVYLKAVWDECGQFSDLEVEQRFKISVPSAPDGEVFGTNDALVFNHDTGKLTIFDYKHGAGVLVDAEDNVQLKFYALGAIQSHPEWDVAEIELVIVQPRAHNAGEDEGIKRWSLPMCEVIDFPEELDAAIALCKTDNAPLNAGNHCRFCPASTICTARADAFVKECVNDYAGVSFEDLEASDLSATVVLDDVAKLARILEAYDNLSPWIGAIRERVDQLLLAGVDVPGFKVVEKVARRKWVSDEDEVSSYLDLAYGIPEELSRPRKLVGITEAKRLLKSFVPKDQYSEAERDLTLCFTIKESSGLTTALASDKRVGISPVAAEFGSVQLGN